MTVNLPADPHVSRLAVPLLGLLAAIQTVDPSVASTALIGAGRGLHMSSGVVALAASISTIAVAASVISTGLIADRIGRRKALVAALFVGALGDAMVALAPSTSIYLAGRVIAGVGLGAVYGAAFAFIRAVTPPARVPGAVGVFSAVGGAGVLVFTYLGGVMTAIDWRLGFLTITLMSLLCVPLVFWLLPTQAPIESGKVEVLGQVLLGAGVACVLYAFSRLSFGLGVATVSPFIIGVALLLVFYWRERRVANACFPVELLHDRLFQAAICAGVVYNFGMAVAFLQLTNLWQYVNGLSTKQVALWQVPLSLAGIVAALVFGRLMTRGLTNATVLLVGSIAAAAGYLLLALMHGSTSLIGFLPGILLAGAGVVATSLPFGNLFISQAPPDRFGPVTSARTTVGQFFYAAGFALSTVMVSAYTLSRLGSQLNREAVGAEQVQQGVDAVNSFAMSGTLPDTAIGRVALRHASADYSSAFAMVMVVTAVICLLVGILGWFLSRRGAAASEPTATLAAS